MWYQFWWLHLPSDGIIWDTNEYEIVNVDGPAIEYQEDFVDIDIDLMIMNE